MALKIFAPNPDKFGNFAGFTVDWVVPDQVTTIHLNMRGAGTGDHGNSKYQLGGQIEGDLAVTPGETLRFVLGGAGDPPQLASAPLGGNGGYNGGGRGYRGSHSVGGGGSGATDCRQGGTSLASRVAVAAGAGGFRFSSFFSQDIAGGAGGADTGGQGSGGLALGSGLGGDQAAGGATTTGGQAGALGVGGGSYTGITRADGPGGGGGGYYGGGSGGNTTGDPNLGGPGGGGSNYVGGLTTTTSNQGTISTSGAWWSAFNNQLAPIVIITYNAPPNAPTLQSPVIDAPYFDVALSQDFHFLASDPDGVLPANYPASGDLRYRVGSGAWTTLTNVATFVAFEGTVTFAGNTFLADVGQSVEWQARTHDSAGAVGPWSASGFCSPVHAPDAFVFNPAPTELISNAPSISGNRAGLGLIQTYEIKIVNDVAGAPGSTIFSDTGEVVLPATTVPLVVTMPEASPPLVDGTSYHVLARIAYPGKVYQTGWTDSGPLVADTVTPNNPTATVEPIRASGSVRVTITNPDTDTDPHTPAYNNVYRTDQATGIEIRIGTGVAVNGIFTDPFPGFHRIYRYRVAAVALDGDGQPHEASSP